ncbi:MAG: PBP1A family penicillin-binding protein, partial [Candidatus Binatia bacterium]|nr:PBP1A family penicillin-binding protein [Candidatus Binatia bacterium]
KALWAALLVAFPALLLLATVLGLRFYHRLEKEVVARFSSHRWEMPSKIYSAFTLLYPGLDIRAVGLLDRLDHLAYRSVQRPVQTRGEYFYDPHNGQLQLYLLDFPAPGGTTRPQRVKIQLQGEQIERIVDLDEQVELLTVALEPEVIAGVYNETWEERRVVKLYQVPSLLVKALLAAEDQRFFEHEGIDFWRILGAGWANLLAGEVVQGGSTLTQQLIKNFFLTQEKTFARKLVEISMALIIEKHYSKLEILENYLNEIYLGQRGARSIFGVWEAARFYFGKELHDLTLGEMATIAGMVKAPNRYAPNRHPERALHRRNYVLQRMLELGDISRQEYEAAVQEPLGTSPSPVSTGSAPYFADLVREELQKTYPRHVLATAGLQIYTSLDMHLQRLAEEAVRTGLEELEKKYPRLQREKPEERLQASLIAMQPQTGEIRALVGGRDYRVSQFNRATQARRQPGSIFKPIVYLAALAQEREQRQGRFLPTSRFDDSPFTWVYGDKRWSPGNYRDEYRGLVTLRQALELSLNAATARIAQQVGLEAIRRAARQLGIVSPLPLYPSLVLGAAEVTPFEVAVAFSTIANQGIRAAPRTIKHVVSSEGEMLDRRPIRVEHAIAAEDAYLLTHLLQGVMERGTGRGARQSGFTRPAAGKTGTTNDFGDAWFVGYTPDLVTVVWVGFDQRQSLGLSGAQAALPIWTAFMTRATSGRPPVSFLPPPGVTVVKIDRITGCRATPESRAVIEEAFYSGEEPTEPCFPYVPSGPEATPVSGKTLDFPAVPPQPRALLAERPSVTPKDWAPPPREKEKPWWRLF